LNEKRIFITDCEGPISKNDNAFEITSHFVPQGEKFFKLISRYDDILAEVLRRPCYKAGNTLKLILPFLKAYGVTTQKMREYSAENILLVPSARETLRYVKSIMPAYIVSTSYEPYIYSLCRLIDFPYENAYCTRVDIDKYPLSEEERKILVRLAEEITTMPMIEIPENASSLDDFPEKDRKTIERLDQIFAEISKMQCGQIYREVEPVGGSEKARAVKEIAAKNGTKISNVIYFGDSITDVESFRLIREKKGLAVSFNGNEYAVKEAEIAVLSEHTIPISILAEIFNLSGKDGVLEAAKKWSRETLESFSVNSILLDELRKVKEKYFIKVELITDENRERLCEESSIFRKKVRGEKIGELG